MVRPMKKHTYRLDVLVNGVGHKLGWVEVPFFLAKGDNLYYNGNIVKVTATDTPFEEPVAIVTKVGTAIEAKPVEKLLPEFKQHFMGVFVDKEEK